MQTDTLKIERIGCITKGIDGSDEYLLVWDNEVAHTADSLSQHLTETYYRDTHRPGGYYCHSVSVIEDPSHGGYKHIAVVHHRYDV